VALSPGAFQFVAIDTISSLRTHRVKQSSALFFWIADKIYLNRENRKWLKDHVNQAAGKPLGRPSKEMMTEEYKQQSILDKGVRNGLEASFGTGKRIYHANDIRAKLPDTGDTWTAMCFLVKNVKKFLKDLLFGLFQKWGILPKYLRMLSLFSNDYLLHSPAPCGHGQKMGFWRC